MSRYPEIKPEVVRAVEESALHRILAPTDKELMRQHKLSRASIFRIIREAKASGRFNEAIVSISKIAGTTQLGDGVSPSEETHAQSKTDQLRPADDV